MDDSESSPPQQLFNTTQIVLEDVSSCEQHFNTPDLPMTRRSLDDVRRILDWSQVVFEDVHSAEQPFNAHKFLTDCLQLPDGGWVEKELSQITEVDEGGHCIIVYLDLSYVDCRKVVLLRMTIDPSGVIKPLDASKGWMRALEIFHVIDLKEFIRMKAVLEVEELLWGACHPSMVFSSSPAWTDMKIVSGTQKELVFTAADLSSNTVVSDMWCGTSAHGTPLDGKTVFGSVSLKDDYEGESEPADSAKETFKVVATASDPDHSRHPVIAHSNRTFVYPERDDT